jgi:MSHA biogenesis protein MshJ
MKLPAGLEKHLARFDAMSLRERGLLAAAALVAIAMGWVMLVVDPLLARQKLLQSEAANLNSSITAAAQTMETTVASDPSRGVLEHERQLQQRLDDANTQLASRSAGLIPPQLMVQVIHDVLSSQSAVTLVSLQNKPVTTLLESAPTADPAATDAATQAGPYVHRVELVVEGRYLDILAYLHALEALQWRFYWRALELQTTAYPMNRVRIELSTLSLDKDWIGV